MGHPQRPSNTPMHIFNVTHIHIMNLPFQLIDNGKVEMGGYNAFHGGGHHGPGNGLAGYTPRDHRDTIR